MKSDKIKEISISALFFAIGIILPYFTMNMKAIGRLLLPMHYPVLLCSLICGPIYGAIIGVLLPITRHFLVGMPAIYPTAIAMCVELLVYGFLSGFLYGHAKYKCLKTLYISLIVTMILGRVSWGIVYYFLVKGIGQEFTAIMFISQAFISGIPGIVLQLIIIPIIMIAIKRAKLYNIFKDK